MEMQAMAARAACRQMTAPALGVMHEPVERVSCLPSRPAANGMTVSSRQRLPAQLRAGDAGGAGLEMESGTVDDSFSVPLRFRAQGGNDRPGRSVGRMGG